MHTGKEGNTQIIDYGGACRMIYLSALMPKAIAMERLCKIRCHTMTPGTARQHSCLQDFEAYDKRECCHTNVIRRCNMPIEQERLNLRVAKSMYESINCICY